MGIISEQQLQSPFDRIKNRSDQLMNYFLAAFFAGGMLLAGFYDTWFVGIAVGGCCLLAYYSTRRLLPESNLYQYVLSAVFAIFMAQYIYQMHGLFEMHFIAFIGCTILITYQNWKLQIPLIIIVLIHHALFAYLQYTGIKEIYFTQLEYMDIQTFIIHGMLATAIVFISGLWAFTLHKTTLRDAKLVHDLQHQKFELIKAKELAEQSQKVKEQFLANMSHEIRTPMNAIIGMTEILEETSLGKEQKECADVIKLSAVNLLSIINDILDFSKIESGKITFEKEPLELKKVLEGIVQTLHFTVNKKSISLSYSVSDTVPPVIIGDVVRLRQILLNLCGNAIKFTERGGVWIDVRLKEQKNEEYTILFTVSDTGVGIPEDKLQSIFESFVQASADTTRKYGGTGLGLAITKELVELQGGTIFVKSKQNEGSQFLFTLTFETIKAGQLQVSDKKEYIYAGLKGIKVLLAEDNSMNQILAKKILNKWDLTFDIASNGKIAIEKLYCNDYDIILMDMHMPEMDGYQTAKYIRKEMLPPKSGTPIIAITANALVGEEDKCLAAGMNGYISKPLDKEKLYQKMLELLHKNNF